MCRRSCSSSRNALSCTSSKKDRLASCLFALPPPPSSSWSLTPIPSTSTSSTSFFVPCSSQPAWTSTVSEFKTQVHRWGFF
ncbi:hypothetical protein HMI56_003511 [Coelomomyces lativittatus]|nr:hypothetical protein HMI56_003511 [Coelomomyces lativittatus]